MSYNSKAFLDYQERQLEPEVLRGTARRWREIKQPIPVSQLYPLVSEYEQTRREDERIEKHILSKLLLLLILFASCTSTHLHKSGYYRVRAIDNQNYYYLDGVKGKYKLPDNKAKVGDKIKLQRVFDSTKANIIRL